jgi:hypothetical protein
MSDSKFFTQRFRWIYFIIKSIDNVLIIFTFYLCLTFHLSLESRIDHIEIQGVSCLISSLCRSHHTDLKEDIWTLIFSGMIPAIQPESSDNKLLHIKPSNKTIA